MEFLWYLVAGVLSGVLGGMGMGGGTLLIPLLYIFFNVNQHTAQAVNLISFIPMAIIAILIHLKNKLVKFDGVLLVIFPALISCVIGSYLSKLVTGEVLRKCFGVVLILLSIYQFVVFFVQKKRKKQ